MKKKHTKTERALVDKVQRLEERLDDALDRSEHDNLRLSSYRDEVKALRKKRGLDSCHECGGQFPLWFCERVEAGGIFGVGTEMGEWVIYLCLHCLNDYPYPEPGEEEDDYLARRVAAENEAKVP
jgi:hypothetical protein